MANISISYQEMEGAAAQLGAGRDEITAKLQQLQGQIQGLVGSGFVTDTASKRFEASYTEYTASANRVIEKLTEIQQFITHAAAAHRAMDDEIAARIR
ncbi:WXG100 family type VII secretion target [Mycolicibacterium mucogenicum 261Sha1.1M5]|nr:WXG100 family type VII secretion target [Mycolicibacterium mucogenicum 261Sha1.1M5]